MNDSLVKKNDYCGKVTDAQRLNMLKSMHILVNFRYILRKQQLDYPSMTDTLDIFLSYFYHSLLLPKSKLRIDK